MAIYKIENLSFKYSKAKEYALCDVTFNIDEGDFVLICGKSGCGKSTLLRLMKQSLAPKGDISGSIKFLDKDILLIDDKTIAGDIGYVMQNPENQIVCDDIYGEMCFGMSHLGFDRDEMRKRVFEVSNYFGINHFLDMDISELSGGQKQLLSIAAVLCQRPKVLLLDEPTANLDPNSIQLLMGALERINRELGITVVISEQDLNDIYPMCNKVVAMESGSVSFVSDKKSIGKKISEYESKDAFPIYVRAYCGFDGGESCPENMKEARKWFKGRDILSESQEASVELLGEKAIDVKDLWLRFEKNGRDILKGVNMEVKKGEFTCVLGANGSGKSTLLMALCGLKKSYCGKVDVDGKKALVGQSPLDLLSGFTVKEEFKNQDSELFDVFEIRQLMKRHPYDLSGGEVNRVVLTKALLLNTDILFLDEVTNGIGEYFKKRLAEVLKERQKRGLSIIMASHDLEFCATYANTCHLLFNGSIAAYGDVRKIIYNNDYYTTKARIMTKGIATGIITDRDVMARCLK